MNKKLLLSFGLSLLIAPFMAYATTATFNVLNTSTAYQYKTITVKGIFTWKAAPYYGAPPECQPEVTINAPTATATKNQAAHVSFPVSTISANCLNAGPIQVEYSITTVNDQTKTNGSSCRTVIYLEKGRDLDTAIQVTLQSNNFYCVGATSISKSKRR